MGLTQTNGTKKSVCLRQKTTKKKTVIHVSRKAPDAQSDLHEKQGSVRWDQCKSNPFVVFTQQKRTIFIGGPREASLSSSCAAATQPAELHCISIIVTYFLLLLFI